MRAKVTSIELGGVTNLAVLAPIKAGFVAGFESITYLERLQRLFRALQAARQNLRESELRKPVFPDSIGRFGIIQNFRYAIVPPDPAPSGMAEPGTSRLSLNVTFDGGWEPYMRVIYRDIGTLLDALFCHCVGYPGSRNSFDKYCRWVRDHEIDGGLFYTDSSISPGDQRYLAEVERLQRETPDRDQADQAIARLALDSERQQRARALQAVWSDPASTLALPLRTLKGLYRLSVYFPANTADGTVLVRFAQSVLQEFRLVVARPELQNSALWKPIKGALADELAWLGGKHDPPTRTDRLAYAPAALQAMILGRDDAVTHGCVVMLRVRNPAAALPFLAKLAGLCGDPADAAQVRHHVAFTHAGLAVLGIAAERLDALPQEFVEGMEARCGLLGDVRGNHPDRWLRPASYRAAAPGVRIDLTQVHLVVLLRLIEAGNPAQAELHPRLAPAIAALEAAASGLDVLALQSTRSNRSAGQTREHFGFADGFSQPHVVHGKAPAPRSDEIRAGELLLGYCNDRDDGPFPAEPDPLLDNGSFLVMRKLRQRVDHLEAALGAHPAKSEVLAKMMGRRQDGAPLVPLEPSGGPNDFNYDSDRGGAACPFHSHVRRANPRDGRSHLPRILRRGMSYGPPLAEAGPAAERGIVFMAYCASIAEQFETVQRWIAGGNSSGVSSSQADPFLAVPQPGEKRTFRYLDAAGKVARVDLGDKPFVELEWGLYLFVPSLEALRNMADFRSKPAEPKTEPASEPRDPLEDWRRRLEDKERSKAMWKAVRDQPDGLLEASPYGTLLGTRSRVLEVLKDDGSRYSVQGYGKRMDVSIGLNHLGIDHALRNDGLATEINAAIEHIGMSEAFDATLEWVEKALVAFRQLKQPDPSGPVRVPVDLVSLSEFVLAQLCARWVGLPDGKLMVPGGRVDGDSRPPRCPGHLLTASRYVFAPHPRTAVLADGPAQGDAALKAVEALLAAGHQLGPLAADIQTRLLALNAPGEIARAIAGVLLGFPPTVHGNFIRTMETWIDDKVLWACQQLLAEIPASSGTRFERARQALLKPLFKTMRERPIPEMLWRCPVDAGNVVHDDERRVVLGVASALAGREDSDMLMFGGSRAGSGNSTELDTVHACPGYKMGTGVLLGLIAGLLDAGTLRPTGSPVLLMLTPRAS